MQISKSLKMLKIVSHTIISFIFLIATTGLTINLHYSQNKLYDVGIYTEAQSCCGDLTHHNSCCQKEKSTNHCEDKTIEMKVKDEFNFTSSNFELEPSSFINLFLVSFVSNIVLDNQENVEHINEYPDISPPGSKAFLSVIQSYLL